MLEIAGGNRDEVGVTQRWYTPAGAVDPTSEVINREIGEPRDTWRKEKSLGMLDPDPDSLHSG